MREVILIFLASGLVPIYQAAKSISLTTLKWPLLFAVLAWLYWIVTAQMNLRYRTGFVGDLNTYIALAFTGCAGIAVFGARRPSAGGWYLVVAALFTVIVSFLAQEKFLGIEVVPQFRYVFLTLVWSVGATNYLPTQLGPAAVLLISACSAFTWLIVSGDKSGIVNLPPWIRNTVPLEPRDPWELSFVHMAFLLLGAVPWLAWLQIAMRRRPTNEVDRLWLNFRDGYGIVWALRVQEQFNASAHNAGSKAWLGWSGLQGEVTDLEPLIEIMKALLKRFGNW